jgi:hypothetical protein
MNAWKVKVVEDVVVAGEGVTADRAKAEVVRYLAANPEQLAQVIGVVAEDVVVIGAAAITPEPEPEDTCDEDIDEDYCTCEKCEDDTEFSGDTCSDCGREIA